MQLIGGVKMKNVVITGSTRGIGLAMAKEFLRTKCNVTISGRNETLTEDTKKELISFQEHYIYIQCDVQDKKAIQDLWDKSLDKWDTIDIWINNAGINTPHVFTWETTEKSTENIIQTNIIGMIFGSQIACAGMNKQGYGAIYSMEGLGSNNRIQPQTILYATTKQRISYFMQRLAKELKGTKIIAGRLSPGMMLTDFIIKAPNGKESDVIKDKSFKKIFNILGDKPEIVAKFFIPKILNNQKNDKQIIWLTNVKVVWRFMTASLRKNRLL